MASRMPSAGRCCVHWTLVVCAAVALAAPAARAAMLYVLNSAQDIVQVSSAGVVSPFSTLPAGSFPSGLAVDSSGNVYAADSFTDQISKITPSGAVSLFATLPPGTGPRGLALDSSGNLYSANNFSSDISKITPDGRVSHFATLPANPWSLTADKSGNLYSVVGPSSDELSKISKITPGGEVSTFATPHNAELRYLAFDDIGNLYAGDINADRILKVTADGLVSTFAVLPPNYLPQGLAFDGDGKLYVAVFAILNSRITPQITMISTISPDGLTVTPFATLTGGYYELAIAFAPIPEPSSTVLLAAAGSLVLCRRRKKTMEVHYS